MKIALSVAPSPHVRDAWTTQKIMGAVSLALMPAAVVGVAVNGLHSLLVILISVAFAVGTEFLFDALCRRPATYLDGSAVVTGLLLALSLSPGVPLYIPALGAAFAIGVVKCCFGGLGRNFVNPALAARCFLLISFPGIMTAFPADGVSSATPVATLLTGHAVNVTKMFLGTAGGVIGASIFALLLGGLALWAPDIIHGWICFSVLGSFVLFVGLTGGQGFDPAYLAAQICGGGVIMGAFFMATDYATSPTSKAGQIFYGVLIGVLGGIFRVYGSAADSFSYAILCGNLCVPALELFVVPKPFAYRQAAADALAGRPASYRWKPVVAVAAVAVVSLLAVGGVYSVTKDAIADQRMSGSVAAYKTVCPGAESFATESATADAISALGGGVYGSDFGQVRIEEAFAALDASGSVVGYAIGVTSDDGNDGPITLAVGVAPDGLVNGITFIELNETPGLGMRCGEPEFMDQFAGKDVTRFTLGTDIDAVSGATVTSTATVNAVNAGLDFFHSAMKGGNA